VVDNPENVNFARMYLVLESERKQPRETILDWIGPLEDT
jgi:hypothetical protein